MTPRAPGLCRSVLYVPASNGRALAKLPTLACDAAIVDLEDSVSPADKAAARQALAGIVAPRDGRRQRVAIRINPLAGAWGDDDLAQPAPGQLVAERQAERGGRVHW